MTELLKRWGELEPERVKVTPVAAYLKPPINSTMHYLELEHEPAFRGVLLAAVIEAIEAQEGIWDYRLAWRMAPTGEHFGVVRVTREDGWEKSWSCYAGSPAAALLGAYVAALEAEAGQ